MDGFRRLLRIYSGWVVPHIVHFVYNSNNSGDWDNLYSDGDYESTCHWGWTPPCVILG